MNEELVFSLEYWRDRAELFEDLIRDMKAQRVDLQNRFIERLENENAELKGVLVNLTAAITAQLKYRTDELIPKYGDAELNVKRYQSRHIQVNTLEMSTRSAKALKNEGLKTLGDLCLCTESDLLRIQNFGRRSLNEVKGILHSHGLSLNPYSLEK
jgi:DNA-directed RNA polymerase alpha subunit